MVPPDPTHDLALAWVDHLRNGGQEPWTTWSREPREPREPSRAEVLPGAQQLELLRRLNEVTSPDPELVEHVLMAGVPGRGQPELDLLGPGPERPYGRAPVDPGSLPARELVRVAALVIAERLASRDAVPEPEPTKARSGFWRRSRPLRFHLGGDHWMATFGRDAAASAGHPPGGAQVVVLFGRDLPGLLADTWAYRCSHDAVQRWPAWLRSARAADRVPPRADLAAAARFWLPRVGRDRVHIVLGHEPEVLRQLAQVPVSLPEPPRLSAAATELIRRTGQALGVLVTDTGRDTLRRELAPELATIDDGPPLALPDDIAPWVAEQARHQARELADGGYPVHGDLEILTRSGLAPEGAQTAPSDDAVLDVALRYLTRIPTTPNEEARA